MDLTLAGTTGFDLIAKMHSMERLSKIPVIMLTQHSDSESVLEKYVLSPMGPCSNQASDLEKAFFIWLLSSKRTLSNVSAVSFLSMSAIS